MKRRRPLLALILIPATLFFLAACGDDADTTDTDDQNQDPQSSGIVVSATNIINSVAKATCMHEMDCAAEYGTPFTTEAECVDFYENWLGGEAGLLADPDYYSFDQEAAQACIEKMALGECGGDFDADTDADCEAAIVGNLQENACCDQNDGCTTGLYCRAPYQETGKCLLLAAEGHGCTFDYDCAEGLYCEYGPVNTTVCIPFVHIIDACTENSECDTGFCQDDYCQKAPLVGEACKTGVTNEGECPKWASCIGTGSSGICEAFAKLGETCDPAEDTDPECSFVLGQECDAVSLKCVAYPKLGEACDYTCWPMSESYCAGDPGDIFAPSTCTGFQNIGETCSDAPDNCPPDAYCDVDYVEGTQFCVAWPTCD
ncbi:hypothetical protein KAI87_13800 [Myxococcota bacterium]|nr:hypothetical protein [Myxococcota bacterium]